MTEFASRHFPPEDLFRVLIPQLRTVVPFDFVTFALYDSSREIMNLYMSESEWPAIPLELPVEESAEGLVWTNQAPLLIDDLSAEKRFKPELRRLRKHQLRSYCVLPLTTVGRRLGSLGFGRKPGPEFSSQEVEFLRCASKIAALCVDTSLPAATLVEERDRLRLLLEIDSFHAWEPDPIAAILMPLKKWARHDYVGIYLYDGGSQSLLLHTPDSRFTESMAPQGITRLDDTLAGKVFRRRELEVLNYSDLAALPYASVKRGLELGVRSLCLVPLVASNGPLGVLKVASRKDHAFSQREVELLKEVATAATPFLSTAESDRPGRFAAVAGRDGPGPRTPSHQEGDSLARLREVATTLGPTLDLQQLLPTISIRLQKVIPHDHAAVAFCDPGGKFMRVHALDPGLAERLGPDGGIVPLEVPVTSQDFLDRSTVILRHADLLQMPMSVVKQGLELGIRSLCCVPLVTAKGPLGVLGLASYRDNAFSRDDLDLLAQVATEGALTLENGMVYTALQQEKDLLQVLREIDATLVSHPDVQPLFRAITACIRKVILYDFSGIWLYDAKNHGMRARALDSRVGDLFTEGEMAPFDECLLAQSLQNQEPRIIGHAELELAAAMFPSARRVIDRNLRSVCVVPLITPKGPVGALALASLRDQSFSIEDTRLLTHAANSIALALENALAHEALQQEKERLQMLLEISVALSRSKLDFRQTFPTISECIQKVVPHDQAAVSVVEEGGETVRVHAVDASFAEVAKQDMVIPLQESLLGKLLGEHEGRTFTRGELEAYAPRLPVLRRVMEQGLQSLCHVPLVSPRGTLGALFLTRQSQTPFRDEDLDFLKRVASELSLAVESGIARQALVHEKERLQALREIDTTLVSTLDLAKLLPAVSDCLRKVVPHDNLGVFLFDEKANALRDHTPPFGTNQKIIPGDGLLPLDTSIAGRAFTEGKTKLLNYQELAKLVSPLAQRAMKEGVRSICFVPLITAKGALGVLLLSSNLNDDFRPEDVDLLEQVAAALAQTLGNALAHKALRQEEQRLQVLLKTGTSVASSLDVRQTFPMISACMRQLQQHEFASLILRDDARGILYGHVLDFPLGKGILTADATANLEHSPAGKSVRDRLPMIFSRDEIAAFNTQFTTELLQEGIKSLCCIPLTTSKDVLGTLNLGSTKVNAFKPDDYGLLKQIAEQIAAALENERAYREIEQLKNRLAEEKLYLEGEIRTHLDFGEIVGQSLALKQVLSEVVTVATSDATVLVLGETGTGKELVARAIHRMSRRKERSFIKVNCAAIPTGLLESELFGHEKGAFTGAVSQKIGRMELAHEGTLFLDEVGEIPLELQPKLLRVLQDHEFERLGGNKTIKIDLRLIAATNRDLAQSVSMHEFRSDLFYRLNVFPIRVPPLRERPSDIPLLVRHFVFKYARRMERSIETIPSATMNALVNWDWPGNVRELENFIERAVILSEGTVLRAPLTELHSPSQNGNGLNHTLENAEREHIIRVLRETGGLISGPEGAAHKLGLKRTTLQSKMQRLKITRKDYSGDQNGIRARSQAK